MPLSLAQLTTPRTKDEELALFLASLQGRERVTKTGDGTGDLTTSGTPAVAGAVVVEITTSGEKGAAVFRWLLDAVEQAAGVTVPSGGTYALGTTGVTVTFLAGPAGYGTSFVDGDTYAFEIATPSFPVTSWREGDQARTLVETDAEANASASRMRAQLARAGFLDAFLSTASDPKPPSAWLDLVAEQVYGIARIAAVATQGTVVLTDAGSAGPFSIVPGQLWVKSTSGLRYQNTTGGTLAKGGTLALTFQAESPGAAYNAANGTITTLATSLAGVTVANPDPGGGTWVTVQGSDAETNDALVARCKARWSELGTGSPAAAYDLWARTASATVKRTKVAASGSVAGRVDLYLAGDAGPVAAGVVTAVSTYVTPRMPLEATLNAASATGLAVTVTATLFGKAQYETAAKAAAQAAVEALFRSIPINGTVYKSAIIEALMSPTGVENVTLAAPAGDTTLTASQVATLTLSAFGWTNT
jgi:uncharacterized phage protein gp47/JayE